MSISQLVKGLGGSNIPSPLGIRTVRVGIGDLDAVDEVDLFTVIGGDILLTGLYGEVTEVIGAGATLLQLHHTPTVGGVQVDLCAEITAHIGADIVGTIYTITGAHADDMVTDATREGVAAASFETNFDILVPGVITLDVTGALNTGTIRWTIHWVPLDTRSEVLVA